MWNVFGWTLQKIVFGEKNFIWNKFYSLSVTFPSTGTCSCIRSCHFCIMVFSNSLAGMAQNTFWTAVQTSTSVANLTPSKVAVLFPKMCIFAFSRVEDVMHFHFPRLWVSKTSRVRGLRGNVVHCAVSFLTGYWQIHSIKLVSRLIVVLRTLFWSCRYWIILHAHFCFIPIGSTACPYKDFSYYFWDNHVDISIL